MASEKYTSLLPSSETTEPEAERIDTSDVGQTTSFSVQPESGGRQACDTSVRSDFAFDLSNGHFAHTANNLIIGSKSCIKCEQSETESGHALAKKIFTNPVTDKYKHFATVLQRQRCPFLVPILKMVDEQRKRFQIISPYMPGGNLGTLLSRGMPNPEQDMRCTAITIAYQITAAIGFLHSRNVVHGDLKPHHVLFDQHRNIRLVDYGMYTAYSDIDTCQLHTIPPAVDKYVNTRVCFVGDWRSFATVLLQMLMHLNSDEQKLDEALRYLSTLLSKLKKTLDSGGPYSSVRFQLKNKKLFFQRNERTANVSFNCRPFLDQYVDKNMWPMDIITYKTVDVLLKCLFVTCDRTTSRELTAELKSVMKVCKPPLDAVIGMQDNTNRCWYCMVETVHPDSEMKFRHTKCPETCPFLRACSSCMLLFGSHCAVDNDVCDCEHKDSSNIDYVERICHVHQCMIEPMIGGSRSYAMILHGTSHDIAKDTTHDAMNMLQLASHPKVMQIPFKNVFGISIPSESGSDSEKRCATFVDHVLHGDPSYFLFYYSGHQLVQERNKEEPRPEYKQLVETLKKCLSAVCKVCPRILMIFDCCYASEVVELLDVKLGVGSHVEWHAQWMASSWKQESNVDSGCNVSRFTELVVSALKGGIQRSCPVDAPDCYACKKFRRSCAESRCVSLYDAVEVVRKHAHGRQLTTQSDPSDVQSPLLKGTFHCEPIISFFNKDSQLYTFFVEDMSAHTVHKYTTDDLHASNIWRMTADRRHEETHKLEFYERYSMRLLSQINVSEEDVTSDKCKPILEAVSKDSECLLVKFVPVSAQVT